MSINALKRSLFDQLIDVVSIKAGLLLPQSKAISLLNSEVSDDGWWNENLDTGIRIHFDEYEEIFLSLMAAVGALPDNNHPYSCLINYVRKQAAYFGLSPDNNMALYNTVMLLTEELNQYIHAAKPISEKTSCFPDFEKIKNEYLNRHFYYANPPVEADWDNTIPLASLFQSERIEGNEKEESYFDQRYIDYLNKQTNDLHDIHWRQFEYLTGEYFKRTGYDVTVNKGRGDGGIDVVAKKTDEIIGPEIIYVQCKKYKKNSPVQLDSVRAFWATVNDENATKGIIATTSRLTKGANDYCKARLYRLNACEEKKVIHWIKTMKKC